MREEGVEVRNAGKQERRILTCNGELRLRRSVMKKEKGAHSDSGQKSVREKEIIPLDEYLKINRLPFKMTHAVMSEAAFWGQNQSSFKMAETIMREKQGIEVSDSRIRQTTYHVGKQVFEEDGKKAEEPDRILRGMEYTGEKAGVLYSMVDGAMVNTLKKDADGSSWKENKLGIVFNSNEVRERKRKTEQQRGSCDILKKEYVTYLGGAEEFKKRLLAAAVEDGYGQYRQTVLISDGATWIRNMGDELFPDAVQILDLYHLAENFYTFGKYLFCGDAGKYTPWAEELLGLAKESKTEELLERLQPYKGKSFPPGVPNIYGYVNNNRDKIDYARYKAQGYYVGSGAIESGNKVVVERRCKQAGMRWDERNAQYMLALRAKTESGLWPSKVEPLITAA
jgi:hypothetical protein